MKNMFIELPHGRMINMCLVAAISLGDKEVTFSIVGPEWANETINFKNDKEANEYYNEVKSKFKILRMLV